MVNQRLGRGEGKLSYKFFLGFSVNLYEDGVGTRLQKFRTFLHQTAETQQPIKTQGPHTLSPMQGAEGLRVSFPQRTTVEPGNAANQLVIQTPTDIRLGPQPTNRASHLSAQNSTLIFDEDRSPAHLYFSDTPSPPPTYGSL